MNRQSALSIQWRTWKLCSLLMFLLVLSVRRVDGGKPPTSEEEGNDGGGVGGGGGGSTAGSGGPSGGPSSSHGHSHHHGSGGQHSSRYDKYDKYGSSVYPSSALSYYSAYGYPANYPYNYHSYSPYGADHLYERTGKDFSTRASNNMPMAASGSGSYGYASSKEVTSPEFGGLAMASGGHGWGWGKGGYTGSKVDTSAIGLIGLIGLLSLLQNVLFALTTTTTTTAAAGRKKRDLSDDVTVESPQKEGIHRANEISMMVLPSLNVVAHARNGRVPLECTHREVCTTNKILVKELGLQGRSVGSMISSAITKLLKEVDHTGTIAKHISKASLAGRNGHDCAIVYPICGVLASAPEPLPMLMQPAHFAQLNLNGNFNPQNNKIATEL